MKYLQGIKLSHDCNKNLTCLELYFDYRSLEIFASGAQRSMYGGEIHADNCPALIFPSPNATQNFYKRGRLHRDNRLPAIVHPNGDKVFYSNGVRTKAIWSSKSR